MNAGIARLAQAMGDDEFASAIERFAESFTCYRDRLPMIPYAYTRTRLRRTPRYEVVVMRWSPGATSPIHDHGDSRCWVLMMEGGLEVENYERDDAASDVVTLRATGRIALRAGDIDYRGGRRELHRVHNASSGMAYSLQLYSAPIEEYAVVDGHGGHSRIVRAVYDLELPET